MVRYIIRITQITGGDEVEYPSANDFYLKLKPIYNKDGKFIDYRIAYLSENFYKATKLSPNFVMGEKISEIVIKNDNILCLKDIYFNLIPNSKGKYELYIEELDKWYLINIFTDLTDREESLIVIYNDITDTLENIHCKVSDNFVNSNNAFYSNNNIRNIFKDELTDTYNISFFEEELRRLDTGRQLPISFIVGHVNSLKLINDAFGRSIGDKVLARAAKIFKSTLRKEDIISRPGGDKFIVMLPGTTKEAAKSIVDRINNYCSKNPMDYIKISISMVVASKENEKEDINGILKEAEEAMFYRKLSESKAANLEIINHLKNNLEKITFETKAHYKRLEELSLMLAEHLNLSDDEKAELKLLCEFHDIGKIGISNSILQKKESLSRDEWNTIKKHSEIGYNITKEVRDILAIDELILNHHERWDGKGYPSRLKGEKIPVVLRVFAIADAYDAMVDERPYKDRMTKQEALSEIRKNSGSQFDPSIAIRFIEIMENEEQII